MNKEMLLELMDAYGNIRHQIELMEANRKTEYKKLISKYPELQEELDSLEEELGSQLKTAQAQEKLFKKMLDEAIQEFAKTEPIKDKLVLKSKLVSISIQRGEIVYDPKAMDAYALEYRELLAFRSEAEPTSRVTLKKL